MVTINVACGDDGENGEPVGGASGSAGLGGASGSAASVGGADDGGAAGSDRGVAAGGAGLGGAVPTGSAGEGIAGVGGQGGETAQPQHWLAFQLWMDDNDSHSLFVTGVPPQADPVRVAPDVDFWQWTPDGTRLVYATPAAYGGPPNAAFSIAVSATGSLGAPEPLHEPLEEGAYAWRVSLSPNSKTLALQLYEAELSTWYLRPLDGNVGDWMPVAEPVSGPQMPFEWSPDGARAAIVRRDDATHDSLFIVDAATGQSTQGAFGTLRTLQWSADGSRLLAEALDPDAGQRVLYAIDPDAASDAVELSDPALHSDPSVLAVSSDGETVAFSAQESGVRGLFIKQVGSAQPAAQVGEESPSNVVWSESSDQFLYVTTHLYALPRQGEEAVRLNPEGTIAFCSAPPCLRSAGDALLLMTSDANQDLAGNQLYDIDLSTPSPSARLLTAFPGGTIIDFLAVGPHPSQVLLLATDAAGKQGIYLVDRSAAPPSVTPLFEPAPAGTYPAHAPFGWSPDSRLFHLVAAPKGDGYLDLLTATIESGAAALSAPLTPPGRKLTSVGAAWRPRPLP